MTLSDVNRLLNYWQDFPPLRDLVAAFIGFQPPSAAPKPEYLNAEEFRRLMQQTGGKIPGLGPAR